MRTGKVYWKEQLAGRLTETEEGYSFKYDDNYLANAGAKAVSKTLPLQEQAFKSNVLFPFFDGLIPEGWLLDLAQQNWKLNTRDRMGLLLSCCQDCIGAVSVFDESMSEK
jgi:serine/threonine-protein kinase HipA